MQFRVTGSSYQDGLGRNYKRGDIVESNNDLRKMFKNVFVLAENVDAGQVSTSPEESEATKPVSGSEKEHVDLVPDPVADAKAAAAAEAAAEAAAKKLIAPLGQDVSLLFKASILDKPFTVHKNGELYDIVDKNKTRVNPDPLSKQLVVMYFKNNA
jgi:hypothetical protein